MSGNKKKTKSVNGIIGPDGSIITGPHKKINGELPAPPTGYAWYGLPSGGFDSDDWRYLYKIPPPPPPPPKQTLREKIGERIQSLRYALGCWIAGKDLDRFYNPYDDDWDD